MLSILLQIDLKSEFYKILIEPKNAPKTSFPGPLFGRFMYLRMAMGMYYDPATFQALMDQALKGIQETQVYAYLDDIIFPVDSLEEHGEKFRKVMRRFNEANLTLEPFKCQFIQREAEFLGHIGGNGNLKTHLDTIKGVRNFSTNYQEKSYVFFRTCIILPEIHQEFF